MQAVEIMTREVATARPDTSIPDAIAMMVERRVSGLPVLDPTGALVGILTEGDLLRRTELGTARKRPAWLRFLRGPNMAAAEYVRTSTLEVADVMTPNPVTVTSSMPLDEVVALMEREHVRRVPVVNNGHMIGIVSRADLVRALGVAMLSHADAPSGDLEIRAAVLAELARQDWFHNSNITASVRHGAVRLQGLAQSEAVRMAVRVAAERVPGVTSVENAIEVLDPMLTATGV